MIRKKKKLKMKIKGQIVKNISDIYDVLIEGEIITCKCRGLLRHKNIIPLVGDYVLIDKEKCIIESIFPRQNEIVRPKVANITKAFVITSLKHPDLDLNLLDKLLVELEINKIEPVIVITKKDLLEKSKLNEYKKILDYYRNIGYKVIYNTEISKLKKELEDNVTVFMGQTGAGKSTLLNKLFSDLKLQTGDVSIALGRGRHTTRHAEIIIKENIKVLDTPGFSALSFLNFKETDVRDAFLEFKKYSCPFKDCMHLKENECNVIKEVNNKNILASRYENYKNFINEFRR